MHPLEPLSAAELQQSVQLIKTLPVFKPTVRIISIVLREPAKAIVYEALSANRQADVILFDNALNAAFSAVLDLTNDAALEWKAAPAGVQPTLSLDETMECEQAVIGSSAFREALERHYGIIDTSLVMVDIWSAGNYGSEERPLTSTYTTALFSTERTRR